MTNGSITEPTLKVEEIQGNILSGFNKDFQNFLFFQIEEKQVESIRVWLRTLIGRISTEAAVHPFNKEFSQKRKMLGRDPDLSATWLNIAFSFQGLRKFTDDAEKFNVNSPFRLGLPQRSAGLGDPMDNTSPGYPDNWVFGGSKNIPDFILLVAADNETDLNNIVNELKSTVPNGLVLIHEDIGRTRNDLPGHEHFGFKDGISQPGIRGRLSTSNELFTPRLIDSANPLSVDFSRPGQPLVYPGQFVFGYPTQRKRDSRTPGDEAKAGPDWCTNGSFLVYRRLRQDVPLFWRTMKSEAERLSQLEQANLDAVHLASILVGRWRSGTPISRSLMVDIPEMEKDKTGALNNFAFVDKTKTVDDSFSSKLPFRSDSIGNICPFAAHIRKVNPRDGSTDQGPPETTLQFRILRRGIPFGTPIADPFNPTEEELRVERGLLFLCYQTSIENQFEFLSQTWMNSLKNPQSTDPGSFDMIVGLNNQDSNGRTAAFYPSGSSTPVAVTTTANWITPTGGGYFFAPSISALRDQIVK